MNNLKNLGAKIKEIRKKKHLSQEKLAEMVSMNFRSINRIENQHNIPTLETLEKIAEVLEVPITDFFEDSCPSSKDEIIKQINLLMGKMDEKELQTFYKAIFHFYN